MSNHITIQKSTFVTFLLWAFPVIPGWHRMYCDKWISGFLFLFTLGGLGIWWFLDLFLLSSMTQKANRNASDTTASF